MSHGEGNNTRKNLLEKSIHDVQNLSGGDIGYEITHTDHISFLARKRATSAKEYGCLSARKTSERFSDGKEPSSRFKNLQVLRSIVISLSDNFKKQIIATSFGRLRRGQESRAQLFSLLKVGRESVLEFLDITVTNTTNRGTLSRHKKCFVHILLFFQTCNRTKCDHTRLLFAGSRSVMLWYRIQS